VSEDLFGGGVDVAAPAGSAAGSGGGSLADASDRTGLPLAVRMRPRTLDEVVGQGHLLAPGSPLRRLASGEPMSVFLWGPPGTGKTTIASVVSRQSGARFVEVSAVTAGVKEVRAVLDQARRELARGERTVLFVDEVHRFSKTQQDVLLPAVENRLVTLVAATTENPSFSVISPLLSRSLLLTLKPLTDSDVSGLLDRALADERGLAGAYALEDEARATLLRLAGGDARRALTYLEEAAAGATATGSDEITTDVVERAVDRAAIRYDRDGDQHYDVISAFIKSVRGSDVQAALHYLARMIGAGEDPRFIARRLIILASEDIGLADPTALTTAVAAAEAVAMIGMPEGRITLAHATIALALAPKSNAVVAAIGAASADVAAGRVGLVPPHLRDAHYAGAKTYGHGQGYRYAHDEPHGIAAQQYLPDELVDAVYYVPTDHGNEAAVAARLARIEERLGRRKQG
jgi:putative ATPase